MVILFVSVFLSTTNRGTRKGRPPEIASTKALINN